MKEMLHKQYEEEQIAAIKLVNLVTIKVAMPLFLAFWAADWIYARNYIWSFLAIRLSVIPILLAGFFLLRKIKDLDKAQLVMVLMVGCLGLAINTMMFLTEGANSIYYAGLNLVAVGFVAFLPLSMSYSLLTLGIIYLPFFVMAVYLLMTKENWQNAFLHFFFVSGTAVVVMVIRFFTNRLRILEFQSRIALKAEIDSRNKVIQQKTEESVNLRNMGRQFSPQVLRAISSGALKLDNKVKRTQICVCFVDIVNSTNRIIRLDKDQMDAVISRFMDDTIRALLRHDVTVDKFLGDGIIAFSNAPLPKHDFVDQMLLASFEIIEKVKRNQDFYLENWLQKFEIRVGIAVGFANVGFYGTDEAYRTYTAIGPVVNLANRLCSSSQPNRILIASDCRKHINDSSLFSFTSAGQLNLKGFEQDIISGSFVNYHADFESEGLLKDQQCENCHSALVIKVDSQGRYVFDCPRCSQLPMAA